MRGGGVGRSTATQPRIFACFLTYGGDGDPNPQNDPLGHGLAFSCF